MEAAKAQNWAVEPQEQKVVVVVVVVSGIVHGSKCRLLLQSMVKLIARSPRNDCASARNRTGTIKLPKLSRPLPLTELSSSGRNARLTFNFISCFLVLSPYITRVLPCAVLPAPVGATVVATAGEVGRYVRLHTAVAMQAKLG
jgi:hypothetical protein